MVSIQVTNAELPSPVGWVINVFNKFDPVSWCLSPHCSLCRFKQPGLQHLIQILNSARVKPQADIVNSGLARHKHDLRFSESRHSPIRNTFLREASNLLKADRYQSSESAMLATRIIGTILFTELASADIFCEMFRKPERLVVHPLFALAPAA